MSRRGGFMGEKKGVRAGGNFSSSGDQLLHVVGELQEGGGGRKGD